jgi:hypothetical protein
MPRSRRTEAEMIAALKQVEAGRKPEDVVGYRRLHVLLRRRGERVNHKKL